MADAIFAHPRLAPVYDAFDGPRDDLAAYVGIAGELGARRVLDVGCGTGSLAILLAATGRTVVAGCRPGRGFACGGGGRKTGAPRVTWIQGDAAGIPAVGADLALLTGNVAQVVIADEDWMQVLAGHRRRASLARVPGVRDPAARTPGLGGLGR